MRQPWVKTTIIYSVILREIGERLIEQKGLKYAAKVEDMEAKCLPISAKCIMQT